MKVTYFPNKIDNKKSALVLGSFESIHNGHLELIKVARKKAGLVSVMIMDEITSIPKSDKREYLPLEERIQQLADLQVDRVYVVKFSEVKLIDGKEFIKQLVEIANASHLVMGKDFACGNARTYKASDISKDYSSNVLEHKKVNGVKISTSILKEMVIAGEVDVIKSISPFAFSIRTIIKEGEFKLNNISPIKGVYAATVIINEIEYGAKVIIGLSKNKIVIDKLKSKNTPLDSLIIFHKLILPIFSTKQEIMTEEIETQINLYLSTIK